MALGVVPPRVPDARSISAAVVGLRPPCKGPSCLSPLDAWPPSLNFLEIGAFLLNFPWEFLQVPFFATMTAIPHWDGVVACTRATLGDAAISLLAYWVASLRVGTRDWLSAPSVSGLRAYIATGLLITIAIERASTGPWHAGRTPHHARRPALGVGVVPLAQWVVLPLALVYLARRQMAGTAALANAAAAVAFTGA